MIDMAFITYCMMLFVCYAHPMLDAECRSTAGHQCPPAVATAISGECNNKDEKERAGKSSDARPKEILDEKTEMKGELLWRAFVQRDATLFERLLKETPELCTYQEKHELVLALLDNTTENRAKYFLDLFLRYNRLDDFQDAIIMVLERPELGGVVPQDPGKYLLCNILLYKYKMNWLAFRYKKKAEDKWAFIKSEYPSTRCFMDGNLSPLPPDCSGKDILFTMEHLYLPMDDLLVLFSRIDMGAQITPEGDTPFTFAAKTNNWLYLKLFIELGANPFQVNDKGETIFQHCKEDTAQMIKMLWEQKNKKNDDAPPCPAGTVGN